MARNPALHKLCQYIVDNFCIDPKQVNWAREIKIAKKLVKMFPEMRFWEALSRKVIVPGFTLSKLLMVENLYELGKLHEQYLELAAQLPEILIVNLGDQKVGEDILTAKPEKKTVLEFIRN